MSLILKLIDASTKVFGDFYMFKQPEGYLRAMQTLRAGHGPLHEETEKDTVKHGHNEAPGMGDFSLL